MTPRPARFRFTGLAVVAAALGWVFADRPVPPQPARAAAPTTPGAVRPGPVSPPTARDLLAREALGLTAAQRARLTDLAERWEREAAPLEAELTTATGAFARFARSAEQAGRTSLAEIRRQAAEVEALSATLRAARERHGRDALDVLTPSARAEIDRTDRPRGGSR